MESTIGLYKTECITPGAGGKNWLGIRDVERETAEWVRWYNHERIHLSIDYMTPIEREVVYGHHRPTGRGGLNLSLSRTQGGSGCRTPAVRSPPVSASSSAPRTGPNPSTLVMILAGRCGRTRLASSLSSP